MSQSVKSTNKTNLEIADRTNQSNLDIAQMSNDYNMAMLDKQIQEQWKMWQAENEYNSPAAQRERLEEAGYNPFMNQDGGTASSMTAPSAQPAVTPTMVGATMQADPPLNKALSVLQSLQGLAESSASIYNTIEQTKGVSMQNDYTRSSMKTLLDILSNNKQLSDITLGGAKTLKNLEIGIQTETYNQAIETSAQQALQTMRMNTELNYLEPQLQQSLALGAADLKLKYQQGELTKKQVERTIEEIAALARGNRIGDALESTAIQQGKDEAAITSAGVAHAQNNMGADNLYQAIQSFLNSYIFGGNTSVFYNPFTIGYSSEK